jgi:O-antigen/teichoic acid export membrane protein
MPLSVILGIFSDQLIVMFIGKKWLPISNLLFILSIAGLMQSLEAVGDSLYPALDKAQTLLWLQIVRTALTGIAVFWGGLYGLFSVAMFIMISRTLLFIASQFLIKQVIKIGLIELMKKILGPLAACSIMFAVYYPFRNEMFYSKVNFIIVLLFGGLAYGIAILIFNFKDIKYIYLKVKTKAV